MFCSKCGAENKIESKFCYKCGEELYENVLVETSLGSKKRAKNKTGIIVCCVVAVVLMGFIVCLGMRQNDIQKDKNKGTQTQFSQETEEQYYLSKKISDALVDDELQRTEVWYSEEGNIIKEISYDSTIIYQYDANERVSVVEASDGEESQKFTFSYNKQNNQYVGTSSDVRMDDAYMYMEYIYDEDYDLVSKKIYYNNEVISSELYTYHDNGKVSAIENKTYSFCTAQQYDEEGRLISNRIYDNDNGNVLSGIDYEYKVEKVYEIIHLGDGGQEIRRVTFDRTENGMDIYIAYDDGNISGYAIQSYDCKGHPIRLEEKNTDGDIESYTVNTYDDYGHLILSEQYYKDELVNRTESIYSQK